MVLSCVDAIPSLSPCFSTVQLYEYILHAYFRSFKLVRRLVAVDDLTTISVWTPARSRSSTSTIPSDRSRLDPRKSLLLIHGFGASAVWQWGGQVAAMARTYDLYIPDLIFFGGSHSTSEERSDHFQASSMAALMDKLHVDVFDVVGISYGGLVAYRMATTWPERVRRLVLVDSGFMISKEELTSVLERWGVEHPADLLLPKTASGVAKLMQLAYYKPWPAPTALLKDVLKNMFQEHNEEKRELLDYQLSRMQNYYDVDEYSIPKQESLLIWGEFDEVFPVQIGHRMKEYFGCKSRLEILPKACHMSHAQRPKEFNRTLKDFLSN